MYGGGGRGKALAVFPDMAWGNLLQIKAAGKDIQSLHLRGPKSGVGY